MLREALVYGAWNGASARDLGPLLDPSVECDLLARSGAAVLVRGREAVLDQAEECWRPKRLPVRSEIVLVSGDIIVRAQLTYRPQPLGPAGIAAALRRGRVQFRAVAGVRARPLHGGQG